MKSSTRTASIGWNVTPSQTRGSFWILVACTLVITKIGVFSWNHSIQVPLIEWLNDRSLYPNDPFAAALARYPFPIWSVVAALARVVPLEDLLRVLFVLERLLGLYAAGRFARALAPKSGLAIVAATSLFAFELKSMVGSGTIVATSFEHTGLALPCVLLAAAAFRESRKIAWAVWLAIVFEISPMYGVFAASYFGAEFVLDRESRASWREWIRPVVVLAVLSSYAVFRGLAIAAGPSTIDPSWFTAALVRGSTHLYPATWAAAGFVQVGVFAALFVLVLALGRRDDVRQFREGLVWLLVASVWLVDAFAAPYLFKSPTLMMMQPARAIDVFLCLAGITLIAAASRRLEQAKTPDDRRLWALMLGASFLVWLLPGRWVAAGVLAVVAALPARLIASQLSPRRLALAFVAWTALSAIPLELDRWSRFHEPMRLIFRGPKAETRELAAWAESATPVDSVFLLDGSEEEDLDAFRGLSKRSIFTSVEEGTALFWAPEFVPEWFARLRALGVEPVYRTPDSLDSEFQEAFDALDDDRVAKLKERYRVSHWVVSDRQTSRFRSVWRGGGWQVLEVR